MSTYNPHLLPDIQTLDIDMLKRSELFDADWYVSCFPDVAKSGMDPAEHYLRFAVLLKRNPSPDFDGQRYLEAHPDVAKAGLNPLLHYIREGKKAGFTPTPVARTTSEMHEGASDKALNAPNRRVADGRRLLTRSHNRGHFWYDNHILQALFAQADTITPLPSQVARLLVIAHDFKLLTGCSRSLSHYLNAMSALGGCDLNSIELGPQAHAQVAMNFVDTHDFVIVNSISPFFTNEGMIDLVRQRDATRTAIYLHETEWVFEKLKQTQPERFREFAEALPELNVLCVSHMQKEWLWREYGVENSYVIHEATTLPRPAPLADPASEEDAATSPDMAPQTQAEVLAPVPPKTAAIVHLYYHDLWPEVAAKLQNLGHVGHDLYVTLCSDHPRTDLDEITREIRKTHDQAIILECPNKGMDIGPFVEVINHIAQAKKSYDLIVKVHSKKSLVASGAEAGEAWRKQLFEALLGSPEQVNNILRWFGRDSDVGMIGPKGRMLQLSSHDVREKRNANLEKMEELATRMNVSDTSLNFFAGSMFWCRFGPIAQAIQTAGLTIDDFEPGHAPDKSYGHAMERMFACIIRAARQTVHQIAPFDQVTDTQIGQKPLRILMAGTLQPRKGTTLFSHVADMAANAGLPWKFSWAGMKVSEDVYMSDHVAWLGNLDSEEMFTQLTQCDIFFLSSEDDPFPLCVLEALQARKRVVVYNQTGVSELFDGSNEAPGVVFDTFTPEAAMIALRKAAFFDTDPAAFDKINDSLSVTAFVSRLNEVIGDICQKQTEADLYPAALPEPVLPDPAQAPEAQGAIFATLASAAAWPQLRCALTNLRAMSANIGLYIDPDEGTEHDALATELATLVPQARILSSGGRDGPSFTEALSTFSNTLAEMCDWVVVLNATADVSAQISMLTSPFEVERAMLLLEEEQEGRPIMSRCKEVYQEDNFALLLNRARLRSLADDLHREASTAWTVTDFADWVDAKALHYDPETPLPLGLLKDRYLGEDIYIAASGPSAGYVDKSFFEGKIVIGVNRVFHHIPCKYLVFKEYPGRVLAREIEALNIRPVVARGESGDLEKSKRLRNHLFFTDKRTYFFNHLENGLTAVDLSVIGSDDKLVVSYSSITSAMHLAAYMGARNVILIGHDCGLIDGEATLPGYNTDLTQTPWDQQSQYEEWLGQIEAQTLVVKKMLKKVYGCNVVSINPFVNFGLEGHEYSRRAKA